MELKLFTCSNRCCYMLTDTCIVKMKLLPNDGSMNFCLNNKLVKSVGRASGHIGSLVGETKSTAL